MASTSPGPSPAGPVQGRGGWVVFAAVVLFVSGTFGTIWGLAAILNDQVITVGGQGVIIADFTTWGWIQLVVAVLMILTAWGLFASAGWARWVAVGFATINACLQVAAFPAFPLWSIVVIALDVIVVYQLTVNWRTSY